MIIDAHTHRYPSKAFADPVAFAKPRKEGHWLGLVAPEDGPNLQGWADGEKMASDMQEAKVDDEIKENLKSVFGV